MQQVLQLTLANASLTELDLVVSQATSGGYLDNSYYKAAFITLFKFASAFCLGYIIGSLGVEAIKRWNSSSLKVGKPSKKAYRNLEYGVVYPNNGGFNAADLIFDEDW